MALSDFWEIIDRQTFDGRDIINVYHAKRVQAGATAFNVGHAFIDSVMDSALVDVQNVGVDRTTLDVRNLGTVTDFISIDTSAHSGVLVGPTLPGFNAATIQFNRTRTDMKNGSKRILAGDELEQQNGEWIAAFLTDLNTLAAAMIAPWEEAGAPGVDVAELCIIKRYCIVPAQDPCTAYRLADATEIDANHYVPTTKLVRTKVRSQVSRKILN